MYRGQMNPVFLEEAKMYMEGPTKKMTFELGVDTWEEFGRSLSRESYRRRSVSKNIVYM